MKPPTKREKTTRQPEITSPTSISAKKGKLIILGYLQKGKLEESIANRRGDSLTNKHIIYKVPC